MFGNRLNFKQRVECVDAPYFDAPGTLEAPLGYRATRKSDALEDAALRGDIGALAPMLPPATIVFCALDGSDRAALRGRSTSVFRAVHALLRDCVLRSLRAFPGSYLCRDQEGDLRFMLAFASPQVRDKLCGCSKIQVNCIVMCPVTLSLACN